MIHFETSVHIDRPLDDVFAIVSDPETYPYWNSAVQSVRRAADDDGQDRYRMERQLPSGLAVNVLEVVRANPPDEVVIRTTAGPTPFVYSYQLRAATGGTDLSLDADVELEYVPRGLTALAGRAVKRGVDANFATLKVLLERARVPTGEASPD